MRDKALMPNHALRNAIGEYDRILLSRAHARARVDGLRVAARRRLVLDVFVGEVDGVVTRLRMVLQQ